MAWSKSTRISIMLGIDVVFFIVELTVGLYVQSLALMADAFHMLNDIISLAVGLWAVKAAQQSSTDKYSFGFLRAEILGAAFNAVFLIALCFSIILEAIERLFDPPVVSNPVLILIVGSIGLASNLVGFLVLGGHGHSHGAEEHDHGDEVSAAEEGHSHAHEGPHVHDHADQEEDGVGDIFPEVLIAKAKHIRFRTTEEEQNSTKDSCSTNKSLSKTTSSPKKHRRRTSGFFNNIDDLSIHPASFRQDIIASTKPRQDGTDSEGDNEEEAIVDEAAPTEDSPLLAKSNGKSNGVANGHDHEHGHKKPRHDSWHAGHNHNKPRKPSKGGHSHSHGDMGMNAMILHVIGDALGNVGVIVSALIIWLTPWSGRFYADPVVSLFISAIILKTTIPLTFATAKILLQATPDHLDVIDIKQDIQNIPGVVSCHHVHIWQLSDVQLVASLHIQIAFPISEASGDKYMEISRAARKCLHAYGIHSATIQPEFCLDKDHDHSEDAIIGLDGIVGQARCRMDDEECLLECVDNCTGKGCCAAPATEPQHHHSEHDGHSH
ncbi:Zinc/cadmium resistance protein [Lachnellula subtilissima]|uniref:Zinc/cadmium resistance protein n=1 Tax=Lachnellula subtilissima TaxID=602034 RepID=A0A8H8UF69_9HELO|nr:Zinc/cadmium resistance protein [Lachnellula subtilissima]